MYRNNQYDTDCITWSPAGRILQVEYAMEAVKQGTPVLGLVSNTHVVIAAFKRAQTELAEYQEKVYKIDDNMCIGISGLTADARVIAEYMRSECLNHKYIYDAPMTVGRLVRQVADKSQKKTQSASGRPYGVGLLVAGVDEAGPCLFETCPSGNYFQYRAMAIGGRSTAAKTYLEKHFESFPDADRDALIMHGLEAMNKAASSDTALTTKNISVIVIGKGESFTELGEAQLQSFIEKLERKEEEPDAAMEDAAAASATGGMA
mmetsp:Transcript_69309/g.192982  ORF Transcript_69309/g.192982 Transcript_69309/m.192982 type:complete len:262 (-) Transcript_69309:100-885(-)